MNIIKTENDLLEHINYEFIEMKTYIKEIESDKIGLKRKFTTNFDDVDFPWYDCTIKNKVPKEISDENKKIIYNEVIHMKHKKDKIVIVEIGVHRSVYDDTSTSIFLNNKRDNDIYIGIDIEDKTFLNNHNKNIYTIKERSENINNIKSYFKLIGIKEIDILMIDGYHSIEQVYKEWDYTYFLSQNGIIIMHDTNIHPGPYFLLLSIDTNLYEINKYCSDIYDFGISVIKRINKEPEKLENKQCPIKFIAHRGNINGINYELENHPDYIIQALNQNYDVEIDVYYINNEFYLGHDKPLYKIDETFLENSKIWCHAKNYDALLVMSKNKNIQYFYHEKDPYTLTSNGYIWTYPNNNLGSKSICVLPELYENKSENLKNLKKCYGICTDYIIQYKELLK